MSTPAADWDVYDSGLARRQLEYDSEPYRLSLYTNTKDDHPALFTTEQPCGCEAGDDEWTRNGAMSVQFPRATPEIEAGMSGEVEVAWAALGERADLAWWSRQAGESDSAWQARTSRALNQLDCSPTWNRAPADARRRALGYLMPEAEVEAG